MQKEDKAIKLALIGTVLASIMAGNIAYADDTYTHQYPPHYTAGVGMASSTERTEELGIHEKRAIRKYNVNRGRITDTETQEIIRSLIERGHVAVDSSTGTLQMRTSTMSVLSDYGHVSHRYGASSMSASCDRTTGDGGPNTPGR